MSSQLFDLNLRATCVRLGLLDPTKLEIRKLELTQKRIDSAVLAYYKDHGKPPTTRTGVATRYFDFPITWRQVNSKQARGSRCGLPLDSTLRATCVRLKLAKPRKPFNGHRLGSKSNRPNLSEILVRQAGAKFKADHGRFPMKADGDASDYLGFYDTWSNVDRCARYGRRGMPGNQTLATIFGRKRPPLDKQMVVAAGTTFKQEHGRYPNTSSGEALDYFGFKITWGAVNQWAYQENTSLHAIFGYKPDYSEDNIRVAGEAFRADHGHYPNNRSGDASGYFGFSGTWANVGHCARHGRRGLPGGSSLSRILRGEPKTIDYGILLEACLTFKQGHGRCPTNKDGDASHYFDFEITWSGVESRLAKGYRGFPGGDTIHKFCVRMGLK